MSATEKQKLALCQKLEARKNKCAARFPISRVIFNAPESWPDADLRHADIMRALSQPVTRFAKYHFHHNANGTLTPLSRNIEWRIAALKLAGLKTLDLW